MSKMTFLEKKYIKKHLECVRHITLDPKGPGVVRMHMIPPKADQMDSPFLLLLNGAQLVPLNLSWAILLANYMDQLEKFSGQEISEEEWKSLAVQAVKVTKKTYPGVAKAVLENDLAIMMDSIIAIAYGEEPTVQVGLMSLGEYADKMTAPHRMDLMVSAMTKDGRWHCNQKCLHCYAAGQAMSDTKELSTEEWKKILKILQEANIPQVTFTGGEPTMREDLVELVDAAQWFVTRLNTNGQRLTAELSKQLYEASLDSVQVTLYSDNAEIHNQLVGAEGYEKTLQGIRNAVDAGLIVSINTPLCSINKDFAATLRLANSLGVRYATCSGLIPSGSATTDASLATALTSEELTEVLKEAMSVATELGMELDFTSPGWLSEDVLRGMGYHLVPSCGACLSNMAIAPNGSVVPCQSWLNSVMLGQILGDSWESIWNHEECVRIRKESAKMEHICQLRNGNKEG